jgi:hypothetical protein
MRRALDKQGLIFDDEEFEHMRRSYISDVELPGIQLLRQILGKHFTTRGLDASSLAGA